MHETSRLIIGGGVAGLSTAWHLAQAGQGSDVLLLEAEPHLAAHSSAQNAAILRTLCGDPISTQIAAASARWLRAPTPGFSDVPLVDARGLIFVAGPDRAEEVAAWVRRVEGEIRVEPLSHQRLASLAPAFEGKIAAAWSFPDDGRIDIGALVAGFARGAREQGVTLRRSSQVSELLREGERVVGARLRDGSEVRAETTVLAAGGWAGRLGAAAGSRVRLRPTRRHLLVTEPSPKVDRVWPVLWYFGEEEFYCRPESGGMLLCACEIADIDPDDYRPDPDVRLRIAERAEQHLPSLREAGAAHFWSGVRTLTSDDRFAIGPDPDLSGLFWVAGLGGAGMVCGFEVGRIAAAQLSDTTGETIDPAWLAGLSPARLAERDGAPLAFA